MYCSLAPNFQRPNFIFTIGNDEIPIVDSMAYLGITLDRKISMSLQTAKVVTKAKRSLGMLHHSVGRFTSSAILHTLFTSKILPLLCYCFVGAAPLHKKDWRKLESVQRYGLRLITNDFQSSYTQLQHKTKAIPLVRRYYKMAITLCFKYLNGQRHFPQGFQISTSRAIRRHHCQVYISKLIWQNHSVINIPFYRMLTLFNGLPAVVDNPQIFLNINLFKQHYFKNTIFQQVLHQFHGSILHLFPDL